MNHTHTRLSMSQFISISAFWHLPLLIILWNFLSDEIVPPLLANQNFNFHDMLNDIYMFLSIILTSFNNLFNSVRSCKRWSCRLATRIVYLFLLFRDEILPSLVFVLNCCSCYEMQFCHSSVKYFSSKHTNL